MPLARNDRTLEGEVTYLNHGAVDGAPSSRAASNNSSTNPLDASIPQNPKNPNMIDGVKVEKLQG